MVTLFESPVEGKGPGPSALVSEQLVREAFGAHLELTRLVQEHLSSTVAHIGQIFAFCLRQGGKIAWCGNGGSAADAQHLAAELVGRFERERRALASIALTTDSSVLTCLGNDYGYEQVFSRQVEALLRPPDVLVLISTSGNSPNVLAAARAARRLGVTTVGLLGKEGGRLRSEVEYPLVVPHGQTARIQEMHILIGHALCAVIDGLLSEE